MTINLMQRGGLYYIRRQTKSFWGKKTEYLALAWIPSIDWRSYLESSCTTDDLKAAEYAYEIVSNPDKVIK